MTATFDQFTAPSLVGLTVLLAIGLFFFIRASTKDRTEAALYTTALDDVTLFEKLQQYFANRAYQVTEVNQATGQISLQGKVGASVFLAIFLGGLAAIGLSCLALVLTIASPQWGYWPFGLIVFAPLASWFYWRGATRVERVTFQLLSTDSTDTEVDSPEAAAPTQLKVVAHRDELAALASQLPLKREEAE